MEILAKWCCMSWAGQREFDEFAARRSDETPTSADFVDRIDAEPATCREKFPSAITVFACVFRP